LNYVGSPDIIKNLSTRTNAWSSIYNGRAGDLIIVRATDNFKVAGVVVSIHNQAGGLIEEGDAIMQENEEMEWLYNVHQNNLYYSGSTITAVAIDLPGNSSTLKINVP
jgi:hypothetical protein